MSSLVLLCTVPSISSSNMKSQYWSFEHILECQVHTEKGAKIEASQLFQVRNVLPWANQMPEMPLPVHITSNSMECL